MESFVNNTINKLRNTISTTAAVTATTLNAVLPGNPVTREYEVVEHQCSAGPGLVWKVYSGFKKSTKSEASIFVFEKKQLDQFAKRDRELVLDLLRRGVSQLTRLRHPSVLIVQHPLEESRDSLAFATEPVLASLSNLLGQHRNVPDPVPREIDAGEFYEVEIKYGLLALAEGVAFIHNDAKILHRNICPESVIVSKRGSWKLFGFEFSASPVNPNDFPLKFPFLNVTNQSNDYPALALPNLDYLAPEYVTLATESDPNVTLSSDMFSLGALTYTLYNKGKPLLPTSGSRLSLQADRVSRLSDLKPNTFSCIPDDSRRHVQNLLNADPTLRPDAHQFNKISIFEDVLIRTLQFLDSLFQWDNLEKSKFYKGLPEIIAQMPLRIKINRVIPCLSRELVTPEMVPFVLPNLIYIAEEMSEKEFKEHLLNELRPVFSQSQPIQIPIFLLQRMDLLISKSKNVCPDLLKIEVLDMMCRSLDCVSGSSESASNVIQLQELCLQTIPSLCPLIDQPSIRNKLLPKVKKLCMSTNTLSVRVNCLIAIGKMMDQMDKWSVLDEVIPFLSEIPGREPALIMASVGIIQLTLNNPKLGLTKELMANKIIPFLMPISIENGLSVTQFQTVMSLIKDIIAKVESEQRIKVEQLSEMRAQQSVAVISYNPSNRSLKDVNGFSKLTLNSAAVKSEPEKEVRKMTAKITELPDRVIDLSKSNPKPTDLTSHLMKSNLMSMTSPSQTAPTLANHAQRIPAVTGQNYMFPAPPAGQAVGMPQVLASSNPQSSHPVRPSPPAPAKSDAFDSLSLANISGRSSAKVPMNAMKPNTAPVPLLAPALMSQPVRPATTTTTTVLSKSDLEEFLK
jgi:SCY1-like protein 2